MSALGERQLSSMLALLLLAQHALGKVTSKDTHIVKQIDACPDVGYFFQRALSSNSIEPSCHLCFCQNNGTAICWPRENRRCDEKHYYHVRKKKRDTRSRRSPGFTDVFFRDATRDIFNKQTPEQCKPFESSFSEGCPPADWCTGCTVCDCDANGRWDCHILSFCPDGKGKKQMKKRRSRYKNKIKKRQLSKIKKSTKTTKKPTKTPKKETKKYQPVKKHSKGFKEKKQQKKQNKEKISNKNQKLMQQNKKKKYTKPKKSKIAIPKKNFPKKNTKVNIKTKYKKPITYKSNKGNDKKGKPTTLKTDKVKNVKIDNNDSTIKFAQTFLKKVMASVEKVVTQSQKNLVKAQQPKNIQKRSMSKNYKKGVQKNISNRDINKVQSKIVSKINTKIRKNLSKKKATEKIIVRSRRKREITTHEIITDHDKLISSTTLLNSTTTRNDYYKHKVDLKITTLSKHNNSIKNERNDESSTLDNTTTKIVGMTVIPNGLIINKLQNSLNSLSADKKYRGIIRDKYKYNSSINNLFSNDINHKGNLPCGKFCDVKKTSIKFVGIANKINSTEAQHGKILSNLKSIFRKIFLKSKVKSKSLMIEKVPFRKRNIIKLLCKNIDNCKLNHTAKELQYKLNKLRAESLNILKSAGIIKGLLRLLNSEENKIINTVIHKQLSDNDIDKLNLILTGEFEARYGLFNLTETQRTQIKYIKENTYVLIRSIEKFARILNNIILTLANGSRRTADRYVSKYKTNKEVRDAIVSNKLQKLKNLLKKYNLVQNKFIKRMYNVLNTLENKEMNMTSKVKVNKVSAQNEKINYTVTIENYTKSIFDNLRKLKDLVVRLNSKNRKKRAIMEDDEAIEYLFMLMEYLFKQNQPLDVPPVNDGIDLLIEAIKNAPDIKDIKQKVLNNNPASMRKSDTVITASADNEITESNASSNLLKNKLKEFESIDEEHETYNHNINTNSFNRNIYADANDIDVLQKEFKMNETLNDNSDKKLLSINKEGKKYETFIDDTDEDESLPDTTTTVVETEAPTTEPPRTVNPHKQEVNSINYVTNESKNRIKLEWIEENFNDIEPEKLTQPKETTTQTIELLTRTVKTNDKYADPISSMSQEEDGTGFKKKEDDSYRRQLNLLNSIDYGTEKSFVDSESKEDKYNVESSPLYVG